MGIIRGIRLGRIISRIVRLRYMRLMRAKGILGTRISSIAKGSMAEGILTLAGMILIRRRRSTLWRLPRGLGISIRRRTSSISAPQGSPERTFRKVSTNTMNRLDEEMKPKTTTKACTIITKFVHMTTAILSTESATKCVMN